MLKCVCVCVRAPGKGLLEGKVPGVLLNLLRAGVDFCPVVEEPLQRLRPRRPRRPAHHRLPGVVVPSGARMEGHGDLESVGAAAGKKKTISVVHVVDAGSVPQSSPPRMRSIFRSSVRLPDQRTWGFWGATFRQGRYFKGFP